MTRIKEKVDQKSKKRLLSKSGSKRKSGSTSILASSPSVTAISSQHRPSHSKPAPAKSAKRIKIKRDGKKSSSRKSTPMTISMTTKLTTQSYTVNLTTTKKTKHKSSPSATTLQQEECKVTRTEKKKKKTKKCVDILVPSPSSSPSKTKTKKKQHEKKIDYTPTQLFLPNTSYTVFSREQIPWFQAHQHEIYSSMKNVFQSMIIGDDRNEYHKNMYYNPILQSPPTPPKSTITTATTSNIESSSSKASLLPDIWYTLDSHFIHRLNYEILDFCCFVTLSKQELHTREWLVNRISEIATQEFTNGNNNNNTWTTYKEGGKRTIKAHVFGSYACPEVCTFFSDVDIKLDGVITEMEIVQEQQDQESQPCHQYVSTIDDVESQFQNIQGSKEMVSTTKEGKKQNKKDKVAKWREALMALGDSTTTVPISSDNEKQSDVKVSVIDLTKDSSIIEKETDPLQGIPNDTPLHFVDRESVEDPTNLFASKSQVMNVQNTSGHRLITKENGVYDDIKEKQLEDGNILFVIDRQSVVEDSICYKSDVRISNQSKISKETAIMYDNSVPYDPMISSGNRLSIESNLQSKKKNTNLFIIDRQIVEYPISIDSLVQSGTELDAAQVECHDDNRSAVESRSASIDETDSADPMLGFQSSGIDDDNDAQRFHNFRNVVTKLKDTMQSSNTQNHNNEDNEILDISVVQPTKSSTSNSRCTIQTRYMVINSLKNLGKRLRREGRIIRPETVHVRKGARVPIIYLKTRFEFDSDILINHGDVIDTSAYASSQVYRFRSFAPVTLILKTLLQQTGDMDKPFTGGIGSFKLYVLLSFHIQEHLKHGGNDSPAEILLTFLLRFGHKSSQFSNIQRVAFTAISKDTTLESDGGRADCIFNIDKCKALFAECFSRLMVRLEILSTNPNHSWLSCIIDSLRLRVLRVSSINKQLNMQEKSIEQNIFKGKGDHDGQIPKTKPRKRIRDLRDTHVEDPNNPKFKKPC